MPSQMPTTNQEALMKLLQNVAAGMAAPDADVDFLSGLQTQILSSLRKPFDTASPGSPAAGGPGGPGGGAAMPMSDGSPPPPPGAAPGQLSPMLAALLGGGGNGPLPPGPGGAGGVPGMGGPPGMPPPGMPIGPAGPGFPVRGLSAAPQPPNMDEVRRMLTTAGGRNH